MRSSSDFNLILILGSFGFIAVSAIFGILIGRIKDPKLETASWSIVLIVIVAVVLVMAFSQFPKFQKYFNVGRRLRKVTD